MAEIRRLPREAPPPGGRVPPHNLEAEESVLGSMLLSKNAVGDALEILRPEDFYREAHVAICETVRDLYGQGEPVDAITVAEELRRRGILEDVGGAPYIHTLVSTVPTAANAVYYARIVSELATLRRLIDAATEIASESYEVPEDVESMVNRAEELIFQVAQRRIHQDFRPIRDLLAESMEHLEKLHERQDDVTGLPTGFTDLDMLLSGLQPGNLILIAARPAMGKSTLAMNIAQHVSQHEHRAAVMFSLEMSWMEIVQRMICSEARVDTGKIRTGRMGEAEWRRVSTAVGRLAEAPLYIDDTPSISMGEIRAKCRRLKAKHGLGLVIVDYLQLMQSPRRSENRVQEVSEISRSMKILAKEFEVPVVAVSQLSRQPEQGGSGKPRRPRLADLRECVTGDTLVCLADGRRVPIAELVGATPRVLAMADDGRIVEADSDLVWSVGRKPVVRIRLASGREIRCTERHRLYGARGWVRAGDLAVGDRLAGARELLTTVRPNTNVDTVPREFFERVQSLMRERGITQRAMAATRGTSYGGSSHFRFAPSRALLAEYGALLEDEVLLRQAASDLFWDRVVSIEPAGEEEVFDLTVPGPSSWLADGLVNHNSGALEQDADVVMFVYREDYYDRESEKKGEAEIIVEKHRNGPTGSVDLAFLGQYTRFENLARA